MSSSPGFAQIGSRGGGIRINNYFSLKQNNLICHHRKQRRDEMKNHFKAVYINEGVGLRLKGN